MDEYISREEAVKKIKSCIYTAQDAWESGYNTAMAEIMEWIKRMPTADVQPVKNGYWIEYEKIIGIFGTLCDYMVDNGRCDVFCPYADTKDESDECEAWRTIQKIRGEAENETD